MADVTPHLAFPLRVVRGRFLTVEQGSRRHREDQAEVVLRTRPGTLDHDPDFGLRELVGRLGPVAPALVAAIEREVPGSGFEAQEGALAGRVRNVALAITAEDGEG